MGGGVSKQKSRSLLPSMLSTKSRTGSTAVSKKKANNIDVFLNFIQEQPFTVVTRAAVKIQCSYRRFEARKVLFKLRQLKESQIEAASLYLANLKDSQKIKSNGMGSSSFSGRDTGLTPSSKEEEVAHFSFPNQSFKKSVKTFHSSATSSQRSSPLSPFKSPNNSKTFTFEEIVEGDEEERSAREFVNTKPFSMKKSRKFKSLRTSVKGSVKASVKASMKASTKASVKASVKGSIRSSVKNSVKTSIKASVRTPQLEEPSKNMSSLAEGDSDDDDDSFGNDDLTINDDEGTFEKIYPMIGYVVKTRFVNSQKKVFLNICHNAHVNRIICSPFREYIDTSHYDEDGFIQSISVAICDIIVPSHEFHRAFIFKEGVGLISKSSLTASPSKMKGKAKKKDTKEILAEQVITYLNSISHCLDEKNPPIAGVVDCDEYNIDESYYRLPKIKKMYYGTIPLYYYNKKEHILDFYHPLSWTYLLKQIPNTSNKYPAPESYFNHYYIDPFASQVVNNNGDVSYITNNNAFSVDDVKRRVFPPDLQYPMALSYQCLRGEFDPKNPMKSKESMLAGSTASSMRFGMLGNGNGAGTPTRRGSISPVRKASFSVTFANPPSRPAAPLIKSFSRNYFNVGNDEDDDIPAHQKQFLDALSKLKVGRPVFMDLSFGIMTLYLTRTQKLTQPTLPNGSATNAAHVPYGEAPVARIALCNFVLSTSYDATNHIFYLHFEREHTPEHSQYNQFLISHFFNDISENINVNQLTFQFTEYTELMTMHLMIERHIFYCNYCTNYTATLAAAPTSLSASLPFTLPASPTPASTAPPLFSALEKSSSVKEKDPPSNWNSPSSKAPSFGGGNLISTPALSAPAPLHALERGTSTKGGFGASSKGGFGDSTKGGFGDFSSPSFGSLERSGSFKERENKSFNLGNVGGNNSNTNSAPTPNVPPKIDPPATTVPSVSSTGTNNIVANKPLTVGQSPNYAYAQIKYDEASVSYQPSSKFFALVERFSLFPLTRQKRYWKVDRGLVGVFEDDLKITPNWKNAIEIIPLINKRFQVVWHRRIVRLRKVMTKLHLIDDKTKRIREFFYKGDGEGDQELHTILTCMTQQIQYANAQPFRYYYHYLESLNIFNRLTAPSSPLTSDQLTVHGFESQLQIIVPEPHTSDDDSDIEDPASMAIIDAADDYPNLSSDGTVPTPSNDDDPRILHTVSGAIVTPAPPPLVAILKQGGGGVAAHRIVSQSSANNPAGRKNPKVVYGGYFKVIRYIAKSAVGDKSPENTVPESTSDENEEEVEKIPKTAEEIIDHWQQRLSENYDAFSQGFFNCRLFYLEEIELLLIMQDNKLVSMMKISKILEKPTLQSFAGTSGPSSSAMIAGAGPNNKNNLAIITSNILRRNSTPMKVINKPQSSLLEQPQHTTSPQRRPSIIAKAGNTSQPLLPVAVEILPQIKVPSSKGSYRALGTGMASKLYNLDSDDSEEDDTNSDRDYEENDLFNDLLSSKVAAPSIKSTRSTAGAVTTTISNKVQFAPNIGNNNLTIPNTDVSPSIWIFKALSYDGRTYRFKFHQKPAYDRITKFFYQHCIKPIVKRDPNLFKEDEDEEEEETEPPLPEIVIEADAMKKYARLLRINEKVIGSGVVLKHEKTLLTKDSSIAPKQRRVLLVTDAPRMIFIDTIGSIVRGHVELQNDPKNEVKVLEGNDFEVTVNGTIHRFTATELPDKDPKYWNIRLRQGMSLATK